MNGTRMGTEPLTIELALPRNLQTGLEMSEPELRASLKLLIALGLLREEKTSSGKAAEVAELSKVYFIDELDRHGIPYFTETPEEVEA